MEASKSRSRHKRTKFRSLPGDVGKAVKIAMLEGKVPRWLKKTHTFSFLNRERAKSYKKVIVRKANKRARVKPIPDE